MKNKSIYKMLLIISSLLFIGFIIILTIDYFKYDSIETSFPFYAYVIERCIEFLLPSMLFIIIALIIKNKNDVYDEETFLDINEEVNQTINKEVYRKMHESITCKNGVYRCNLLEQIETRELVFTFNNAILDFISEDKIYVMLDKADSSDNMAMVFYKLDNKLYFNQLFRNDNEPFKIKSNLYWFYPIDAKVTKEEQDKFNITLNQYLLFNKDLLEVE